MKIAKYINIASNEILYAEHPPATKETGGVTFMIMSFTKDLKRTFWYNKEAVKLERIEEVK